MQEVNVVLKKQKILAGKFGLKLGAVSILFGGMAVSVAPSMAGEYTPIGESGGQYKFTRCVDPAIPVLGLDPAKKGNASIRDYNAQVARYNAFIANMQTYMDCLSTEADQDLQTYYDAVSVSLEEKQSTMMLHSNSLRSSLAKGPNIGRAKPRNKNIPALEGATQSIKPGGLRPKGAILPPVENKPLIRLEREDGWVIT